MTNYITTIGMLLAGIAVAGFGCEKQPPDAAETGSRLAPNPPAAVAARGPAATPAAAAAAQTEPVHIADDDAFATTVLQAQLPVLVDFYATWCPPCKQLAPVLEKFAADMQGQVLIAKVDVDKLSGLAGKYGVQSIPHMVLFKDGAQAASRTGFGPGGEANLKKWLQQNL